MPRCPGAPGPWVEPGIGCARGSALVQLQPTGVWQLGVTDTKASKKSVLHLLSNTLVIFDTQIHQVTGARAYFPQLRTSSPDQPGQWPPPGLAQVTQ